MSAKTEPAVYVGTYHKYNSGSLGGAWLTLSDYSDKDEFLEACRNLHKDESDPEFMFQDREGIPAGYASECSIEAELWDWLALDEDDRTILALYRDHGHTGADIDDARDSYAGTADSEADFTQTQAEETECVPKDFPSWICIDWQATWDCNLRHDYFTARDDEGTLHFFRNC